MWPDFGTRTWCYPDAGPACEDDLKRYGYDLRRRGIMGAVWKPEKEIKISVFR
jgi:hypothetical protein